MNALLSDVIDAHGGLARWSEIGALTARLSIGGPIWAAKGWRDALVEETVEIDTRQERSVFTPFLTADRRSVFQVGPERVTIETTAGQPIEERIDARDAFRGHTRATPWDQFHLGYFIGYAFWNYFTTPFLFTWPGVEAKEIEPWEESGQVWRRLRVVFPRGIATHNPEQVFYYDCDCRQRRMDYVTEILGSSLVAHYTSRHRTFGGVAMPTRRRVFRRNEDGTANLNVPSITIDVADVDVR